MTRKPSTLVCLVAVSLLAIRTESYQDQSIGAESDKSKLPVGALSLFGSPFRHNAKVSDVTYSPNGSLLATTGEDASIRVWDSSSNRLLWSWQSDGRQPGMVRFTPDGKEVLAVFGRSLEHWNAQSGQILDRIVQHPTPITSFHISPDSKMVATVSSGFRCPNDIRVTELETRGELLHLSPAEKNFTLIYDIPISFSMDSKNVILKGSDKAIEVWELRPKRKKYSLENETLLGRGWFLAQDGQILVLEAGGDPSRLIFHDLESGKERYQLPYKSNGDFTCSIGQRSVILSPTGETLQEYDLKTGKAIRDIPIRECQYISPDQQLAISHKFAPESHGVTGIHIQSVATTNVLNDFSAPRLFNYGSRVDYSISPNHASVAIIRDGHQTWGCGEGNKVYFGAAWPAMLELREIANGKLLMQREYSQSIGDNSQVNLGFKYAPSGRQAVSWGPWPVMRSWDTANGSKQTGHDGGIKTALTSPDGNTVYSLDETDVVLAWNATTGLKRWELPKTGLSVKAMGLSPNGQYLATLEDMHAWIEVICIWNTSSGKCISRIARNFRHGVQEDGPHLCSLAFLSDELLRVVGCKHSELSLLRWDIEIANAEKKYAGSKENPRDLNDLLQLQDMAVENRIGKLSGREYDVKPLLSRDGKLLLQRIPSDTDCGLRLFDCSSARRLFELPLHAKPKAITCAIVSPNAKLIAFVSSDKTHYDLEIWDVAAEKIQHRISGWKGAVGALAFTDDSKLIAVGAAERMHTDLDDQIFPISVVAESHVYIVNCQTGEKTLSFQAHQNAITSLEFFANDKQILSGSSDSTLTTWNLVDLRKRR